MKFTRAQLSKFLPDADAIRAFEELISLAEGADNKVGAQVLLTPKTATSTTLVDAASVPVLANVPYKFEIYGAFNTASNSFGTRWVIDGPATSILHYTSRYPISQTIQSVNQLTAYNMPASATGTSVDGVFSFDGIIRATAAGSLALKFASSGASAVDLLSGYMRLIRLT